MHNGRPLFKFGRSVGHLKFTTLAKYESDLLCSFGYTLQFVGGKSQLVDTVSGSGIMHHKKRRNKTLWNV